MTLPDSLVYSSDPERQPARHGVDLTPGEQTGGPNGWREALQMAARTGIDVYLRLPCGRLVLRGSQGALEAHPTRPAAEPTHAGATDHLAGIRAALYAIRSGQ